MSLSQIVTLSTIKKTGETLSRYKLGAAKIEVDQRNYISVYNYGNVESFDSFKDTLTGTNYLSTYVLFGITTLRRKVHEDMRLSAEYMLILRDTSFLTYNSDGYRYLLNSDEFHFFIDNFFVGFNPTENQLLDIENEYMFHQCKRHRIYIAKSDFSLMIKVKAKETYEVNEIFEIVKEIVYFFKIFRGFNPQIEKIYLNNVRDIAMKQEYNNVELIINYDFQKRYSDELLYLHKSKFKKVPVEILREKYKRWITLVHDHDTLMRFFINEYYLINDIFLDYCRLIEYIYDNFYCEIDKSKIAQLKADLKNIYSDINFTEYISDLKFRRMYKRKVQKIHFDVIARVIHDVTLGKAPLSEKIKRVDEKNRIDNSDYSGDILIEGTNESFNIYIAINSTRNYYAHLKKDKKLVIKDTNLSRVNNKLEAIILDFFSNHLEIEDTWLSGI